MKSIGFLRGAAMSLAALGMVMPPGQVFAQDQAAAPRVIAKADTRLAADVVLLNGAFTGRVVDHAGTPLKNKEVTVKQGEKIVGRGMTNDKGVFAISNVRPGNYTASSGNTEGTFRVWNEEVAPPAAKGHALLVMGENGARGQFGAVDPTLILLTAAVIASVIISAITLNKVNDIDDRIPASP